MKKKIFISKQTADRKTRPRSSRVASRIDQLGNKLLNAFMAFLPASISNHYESIQSKALKTGLMFFQPDPTPAYDPSPAYERYQQRKTSREEEEAKTAASNATSNAATSSYSSSPATSSYTSSYSSTPKTSAATNSTSSYTNSNQVKSKLRRITQPGITIRLKLTDSPIIRVWTYKK